jgi:D-arabinose 1-dehydrogenase-like Zn-dependent alcohol dehydrogenase
VYKFAGDLAVDRANDAIAHLLAGKARYRLVLDM